MTDPIDLPTIEDPNIELEDSPEFTRAQEKAASGQYDSTLFEIWDTTLDRAIHQTLEPMVLPQVHYLLTTWRWLKYTDMDKYNASRLKKLREAKAVLQACFPKPQELLFLENENDWEEHHTAYIEVIIEWQILANKWAAEWQALKFNDASKGIEHCVVSDMTAMLLNPEFGMMENIRALANFNITSEENEYIGLRINGKADDE